MKRSLPITVLATVALASAAVAGCSSTNSSSSPKSGGSGTGKVGYSTEFLSDPFQAILAKQFVAAANKIGVSTLSPTSANNQASQQDTDIRNLITTGAKGIVVVPGDSAAIAPTIQFANSKNIPVISLDVGPNSGKVAMIVRTDNVLMGAEECESIGKQLGGKGKILELQGALTNINGKDRASGFEDCMKSKYPNITVIAKPTNWDSGKAANATQTVLDANPDLAGVVMASDSVMLSSVLAVLQKAGKTAASGQSGHISVATIDGTAAALAAIRSGAIDAVVSQPLNDYALLAAQYIQQAMKGMSFNAGPTDHNSTIVTFNGNLEDQLKAPVVTKANVDDKTLWGNQAAS